MKKKLMCLLATTAMMLTVAGSAVSAGSIELPPGETTSPAGVPPETGDSAEYTITFPDENIPHEGGTVEFTITGEGLEDPFYLCTGREEWRSVVDVTIQNGVGTASITFPENKDAMFIGYYLDYGTSNQGPWIHFSNENGQRIWVDQDPSPAPRVDTLDPELTTLPSTGGTVVVQLTGQLLDTYVIGKAVSGSDETAVVACVNDPQGKGGSGSFTLHFPANTTSSPKVYSIHTSISDGQYWEDSGVTITVAASAASTGDSSGGSPAPYVPPVTIPTDATSGNASGVKIEMQASQLPSGVEAKDVAFSAKPVASTSTPVKAVEAALSSSNLPEAKDVAVYDLDLLLKSSGKKVAFTGKVKVAIPMPTGYGRFLRVFHVADNGTMTEVPAILNGSSIEVTLEHFSYYAVVDFASAVGTIPAKLTASAAATTTQTSVATAATTANDNTSKNPTTGSEAPYALLLGVLAASGILIRMKLKDRQKA